MIRDPRKAAWAAVNRLLRRYPSAVRLKDDLHQEAWTVLATGDCLAEDTRPLFWRAERAARDFYLRYRFPLTVPPKGEAPAAIEGEISLLKLVVYEPAAEESLREADVAAVLRQTAALLPPAPRKKSMAAERQAELYYRHRGGESFESLAQEFGVSRSVAFRAAQNVGAMLARAA